MTMSNWPLIYNILSRRAKGIKTIELDQKIDDLKAQPMILVELAKERANRDLSGVNQSYAGTNRKELHPTPPR